MYPASEVGSTASESMASRRNEGRTAERRPGQGADERDRERSVSGGARLQRAVGNQALQAVGDSVSHRGTESAGEAGAKGRTLRETEHPPAVEQALARVGRGGQPLDASLRAELGATAGTDLAGVSLHTGPTAHRASRSLDAAAFTVGSDVFFARNRYSPETSAGRRLIAHEVAHTIQQRGVSVEGRSTVSTGAGRAAEREATGFAGAVQERDARRRPSLGRLDQPTIQCQDAESSSPDEEPGLESKGRERVPVIKQVIVDKYGSLLDGALKRSPLSNRIVYHQTSESLTAAKDDFAGRLAAKTFRELSTSEKQSEWLPKYRDHLAVTDTGEPREVKVEMVDPSASGEGGDGGTKTGSDAGEEEIEYRDRSGGQSDEPSDEELLQRQDFADFVRTRLADSLLPTFMNEDIPAFYDHLDGKIHTTMATARVLAHEILHHVTAPAFRQQFAGDINEQLTDYFAREVAREARSRLGEEYPEGYTPISGYETDRVRALLDAGIDEQTLRDAYFTGKSGALNQIEQQLKTMKTGSGGSSGSSQQHQQQGQSTGSE